MQKGIMWIPLLFAGLLLFTAVGKIWNMEEVALETSGIGFVPLPLRTYMPMLLPLLEIFLVALIVFPSTRWMGMCFGTLTLIAFTGYLIWKWYNPNGTGCLCSGGLIPITFSIEVEIVLGMIRNAIFIALNTFWLVKTCRVLRGQGDRDAEEARKEGIYLS